ncbi:MAG TPA: hypothetical protein VMT85_04500 [Thermoanaerobaculia bacterium]|nr:hypothetical protein [Thermoanaerobaculia bacterium]
MSEDETPADEPDGPGPDRRAEGRVREDDGAVDGADGGDGPVDDEGESPFLIIDVKERQSRQRIRELRQGEGPLAETIYDVLEDLYDEGHIADEVQPVVFIVREEPQSSRPED